MISVVLSPVLMGLPTNALYAGKYIQKYGTSRTGVYTARTEPDKNTEVRRILTPICRTWAGYACPRGATLILHPAAAILQPFCDRISIFCLFRDVSHLPCALCGHVAYIPPLSLDTYPVNHPQEIDAKTRTDDTDLETT
jgi:hypothetical protein